MRISLRIILSLLITSCLNAAPNMKANHSSCVSIIAPISDTNTMLKSIPKELIVSQAVNDSDVVVFRKRCVVLAKYSEMELLEMERKSTSVEDWIAFYDDYLFYNEDVSMYICERAMVYIESDKKYIQFIMTTGEKITIDRFKSAGRLFFFKPETGPRQCYSADFQRERFIEF